LFVVFGLVLVSIVNADADATCAQVGAVSGCSGCEQGTNGLCHYVGQKIRTGSSTYTFYLCYSATKAQQLVVSSSIYFYAASVCTSPSTESTYHGAIQTGSGSSSKRATLGSGAGPKKSSSIVSKSVKDGNVEFKGGKQNVDRTASTQPMGGLNGASGKKRTFIKRDGQEAPVDESALRCENFNSERRNTLVSTFSGCNSGFVLDAAAPNSAQQGCIRYLYAAWGAILCPQYGVASVGFSQGIVDVIEQSCANAGCTPTFPWNYQPWLDIPLQLVWPNDVAYTVRHLLDLGVSGVTGIFEDHQNFYPGTVGSGITVPESNAPPGIYNSGTSSTEIVEQPGVEFVVVQALNWNPNNTMNYNDALLILTDPSRQASVSKYVYPTVYFDYYCGGKKRVGCKKRADLGIEDVEKSCEYYTQPFKPPTAGTPGVVYQVTGTLTIPASTGNYLYAYASYPGTFVFNISGVSIDEKLTSTYFNTPSNAGIVQLPFVGVFYTPYSSIDILYVEVNGTDIGDTGASSFVRSNGSPSPSQQCSFCGCF